MNYTLKNRLFVCFAIGFCFIVFNSLGFAGDSGGIQQKEYSGLESPATASKQTYAYRYYPSCSVYYDIHRELYFYLEDDNWKTFASLPSHLKRKLDNSVRIEMDNDKPYIDNDNHVKKYSPENSRKTKNSTWTKLAFVLLYAHPSK